MNTRSLSQSAQKIDRKEPSCFHKKPESTPKKQFLLIKFQQPEFQSTLQKNIHYSSEVKFETIKKDKKKPKRPWTLQEDKLLRELVLTKGAKQWAFISSYFFQRCGKQCRQRWHNHLRNGIKKGDWSYNEEWLLYLGVHAYGKRWSLISKMLEGRTQNTLKNHWNCKMKPKKENYEKKLTNLLKNSTKPHRSLTKYESFLIKIINTKPQIDVQIDLKDEKKEDKLRINLFQKALRDYYEAKKLIYSSFQREDFKQEVKIENEPSKVEWKMVDSFGKSRNSQKNEKSTCYKSKDYAIQGQYFVEHIEPFEMGNEFESDSNSFNIKIQGSIKAVSQKEEEMFKEKESELFYEIQYNHTQHHEKSFIECKSFCEDFYSPFKRNIFEGIDLGQSSKKEKLFE